MEINNPAPDFSLPDLQGTRIRLGDHHGKIVIVNFWSCECPHSERVDELLIDRLSKWEGQVILLSVASNQNESNQSLEKARDSRRLPTVLLDADHAVADLYQAVTTPHMYVIDKEGILRYRGAVDDITFRQRKSTRIFLDEVVEALLNGHFPTLTETTSYGCAIVREI